MSDTSLTMLANLAEIIGAGTIVTALIFGWFQIRHFRVQQRNTIASDLTRTFYNPDLAHAVSLLRGLPDGISAAEIRSKGAEYEEAAVIVTTTFETMGLLVFKRIAPFELVLDLAGGITVVMWRKLSSWQDAVRQEQNQPSWAEWFEWLAARAKNAKLESEPAHVRHRNWEP